MKSEEIVVLDDDDDDKPPPLETPTELNTDAAHSTNRAQADAQTSEAQPQQKKRKRYMDRGNRDAEKEKSKGHGTENTGQAEPESKKDIEKERLKQLNVYELCHTLRENVLHERMIARTASAEKHGLELQIATLQAQVNQQQEQLRTICKILENCTQRNSSNSDSNSNSTSTSTSTSTSNTMKESSSFH